MDQYWSNDAKNSALPSQE